MIEIVLAVTLGAAGVEASASAAGPEISVGSNCSIDTKAMLEMSFMEFDQGNAGWRVPAGLGCEAEAADLIAAYRRHHWGTLQQHEVHISYWHEGQARAMAGNSDAAIPLLLAGVNPSSDFGFSEYALATVAFLNDDWNGLLAARERLLVEPRPPWLTQGEWPQNLSVVDGLIACFGKPYSEAYSGDCRPK